MGADVVGDVVVGEVVGTAVVGVPVGAAVVGVSVGAAVVGTAVVGVSVGAAVVGTAVVGELVGDEVGWAKMWHMHKRATRTCMCQTRQSDSCSEVDPNLLHALHFAFGQASCPDFPG